MARVRQGARMRRANGIIVLACLLAAPHPVPAADRSGVLSLRRFELLDQFSGTAESSELNFYLRAVADSLVLANAYLASSGKPRLFCSDKAPDIQGLRGIVRDRIRFLGGLGKDTEAIKQRVGVVTVIIERLRETYPCR